ncbi:rhamnan synthesis F family protein [Brevibacterium litoralis]|uniref:rhamnan synthesis F family protein n=1 Tax=Brevibacterium litoralis TaxID=3138935 RepID=UPI0032EB4898
MPFAVIDNMTPDRRTLTGKISKGVFFAAHTNYVGGANHTDLEWALDHPAFVEAQDDLLWHDQTVSATKGRGLDVERGFALTFNRPLESHEITAKALGIHVSGRTRSGDGEYSEVEDLTGGNPVIVDRSFVYRQLEQVSSAAADDAIFAQTFSAEILDEVRQARTSRIAVLVHCFYGDVLETVLEHVHRLDPHVPYDLFVDVPDDRLDEASRLQELHPGARVFVVPNRGRDILPFLRVAPFLREAGYTSVLKVHTKKSPTSTIGPAWLRAIMRALVPEDPAVLHQVVDALDSEDTAIIGPERYYYPLSYGFAASDNLRNLVHVIEERTGAVELDDVVDGFYTDFGFFAGTMFWARLDAFEDFYGIETARVEEEPLPTDGTFLHSLERLFGAIPPVLGKKMYSVAIDGRREPFAERPPGTTTPMRPLG